VSVILQKLCRYFRARKRTNTFYSINDGSMFVFTVLIENLLSKREEQEIYLAREFRVSEVCIRKVREIFVLSLE